MAFGSMAPGMPKAKIAKPKKPKKWKPPAMAEHQQHIGGPYQAPQEPTSETDVSDATENESGLGWR